MKRQNRRSRREQEPPKESGKIRLASMLEMPATSLSGMASLQLSGNREAVVEGCQGILEYGEDTVRLSTEGMVIRFTGRDLQIRCMTQDSAVVTGFITSIEFLT